MEKPERKAAAAVTLVAHMALGFVLSLGCVRAFQGGGKDFSVFHSAWRAVLSGQGAGLYHLTTDRFLYAPGFAWLLAPIGLLPEASAMALWTSGKVILLLLLARSLSRRLGTPLGHASTVIGILVFSRPLLIDLQYGQINLWILGFCGLALLSFTGESRKAGQRFLLWLAVGILAVSKLFVLPLLALPWIFVSANRKAEKSGSACGALLALFTPALSLGVTGNVQLFREWKEAILLKGLPLETHNQSFGAMLQRIFTTGPSPYIPLEKHLMLGTQLLSGPQTELLMLAWASICLGVLMTLLVKANRVNGPSSARWTALVCGLVIVPSHLIWKPYFVFGIPAAVAVAANARTSFRRALLFLVFAGVNLTSFDLIGYWWAPRLEAMSLWLILHLLLLGSLVQRGPQSEAEPAGSSA